MAKGVKRIDYKEGKIDKKLSKRTKVIALANEPVVFYISQWEAETTEADKKNGVTWIWQSDSRKVIGKVVIPANQNFKFTIPKNLCGIYSYYIEASLSGKIDVRPVGLHVIGSCEAKISKAHWVLSPNGASISGSVNKGSIVYLDIATEGLNGYKSLAVEIYNTKDEKTSIATLQSTKVIDGAMVVEVKTATLQILEILESFYVKIKNPNTGHYVLDGKKNEKLANTLQVTNAFFLPSYLAPTSIVPSKVGQLNVNHSKIEPCQYTEIDLINSKGEITEIFKEDKTKKASPVVNTGVIVGSHKKKFSIAVDKNSSVAPCFLPSKNRHKQLTVASTPINATIITQTPTKIDFEAWFDYDKISLFDYFFLTESKINSLPSILINANTCRYNHKVYIRPVPDIKWEAYILVLSKTSESFSHTKMPNNKDSFGDPIVSDENGKSTRKNIFQIHQKKARETGITAKKMAKDFTGEVHLKASINNSANHHDYSAGIEDKLNTILGVISGVKGVLDKLSHRDEAKKGSAQKAMKSPIIQKLAGSSPVFIEFSFPTVRLGGGWYLDLDKKDGKIKTIGNLQFGFEPLIQGKGGIDLVAAAENIPPVLPILKALRYVKIGAQWLCDNTPVQINAELYFNLYVKGKIDLRVTVDFLNSTNDKVDSKFSLLLGIELGFKIKATIEKIIYTKSDKAGGGIIEKTGFDGQLSAEAESGIVGVATGGRDEKGIYLQASIDLTGITLKVVGKLSVYQKGKKTKNYGMNDKFDLVDYYKDICKSDKHYVL